MGAKVSQCGDDAYHIVPTKATAILGTDEEQEHAAEHERHVEHEHVDATIWYKGIVSYNDVQEECSLKEILHTETCRGIVLRVFLHHAVDITIRHEQSVGQGRDAKDDENEHDTENGHRGIFLYRYEIQRQEQQCRLVNLVSYEPHYEELPQLPLQYVANAQPCHRGSKHLTEVGEREKEPEAKEKHHGVWIVVAIAPQRPVKACVGYKCNQEDEDVAVCREPRQHDVQEHVALLAREEYGESTTIAPPHGGCVGDGIEHLAVGVAIVATKHVAHAHEEGEKRHVDHQERLALVIARQLIRQGWHQE